MLQELYDRWAEIQKQKIGKPTTVSDEERIEKELNLLEALRIQGCKVVPGETSDIRALISDRHRQMDEALRMRKK